MPLKVYFFVLAIYLTCFYPCFYRLLISFSLLAAALVMAHARISAPKAELKIAREAWDNANTAMVFAEKATKSAENKAKKAEKALAESQQKQAEREQSIAGHLDKISILVGSKCRITPSELLTYAFIC
jgi:biopolymer transport protein ExbB/TolQ